MKSCLLISLISSVISSQIACDWRNCSLVIFTESAAVSATICELISRSADAAAGQQFSDSWQGAAVQTFALCTFMANMSLSETYPNIPTVRELIMYAGLVSGPLFKTTGCQLWQHFAHDIAYFNSLADIPSDSLLARNRSR